MSELVQVRDARLGQDAEVHRLFEILDTLARDPAGQGSTRVGRASTQPGSGSPLAESARTNLGPGLRAAPNALVMFGCLGERVVGAAVCFWGFSTFTGRPSVNIHDFCVLPEARGKGVGTALLDELERRARARGCAKITLEVYDSNTDAKRLYARRGFEGWDPPMLFVAKTL